MEKIAEQIRKLRRLCSHPKISGTGHNEGPWGYGYVSWICTECGSDIIEDTVLKKGTIICFWSTAKLKRTCKRSQIQNSDQEIIFSKRR